ncbi:MAG: NAD(P)-dependent oxidoreductase [Gemmataceae bacterium]
MPRVLVADKLEKPGLETMLQAGLEVDLRPGLKGEELCEALRAADGVIIRSGTTLTARELDQPGKLRVIVRAGVGVDNIDVATATRRGILVMNTPGGNTVSTAEQTIALLFALARHTAAAAASLRAGNWERSRFTGTQLAGKTIGIIGLGRIGREVARRCIGLDMKVIGFDPFITAAATGLEVVSNLETLLPQCDFLTVHTPLSEETRGLIGAAQLALLPTGARVINCARGGIIDESALLAALQSGHLAGAALTQLSLARNDIGDDAVEKLKPLSKLELLILSGTGVSDASVPTLATFQRLWGLSLRNTKVTAAGVSELEKALPKCQIDH